MGTNSQIFYEKSPNEFHGVTCNYDGYLSGVGATLYKHYQDLNKIEKLISLGHISSLDKECETAPRYEMISSYPIDQRHFGYTFAYHRDDGQKLDKPIVKNSLDALIKGFHTYLWKDNQWLVYNDEEKKWNLLKDELIILSQESESGRDYTYIPKSFEMPLSHDDYMAYIRRGFFISKKANAVYSKGDYIKFKATHENQPYELLLQVIDISEEDGIKEDYQLVILSNPPRDFAWFCPVKYV